MAEEVKIVDVAGGPAAEATLQEILKLMRQRGGGGGSSDGTKAAEQAQNLYTESVNRAIPAKKKNTEAVKESTSAFNVLSSTVSGAFGLLTKSLGVATGIITNFGAATMNASSIGEFLEAVPVFGSVLGKASSYFDASLSTFQQLSQTGAGFGNDMLAMRSASAQAGLSLEQFASVIANNSTSMGLLGGTTSDGAARFGRLSKALRQQEAGLMRLGFTQDEVNEGLADYIENQALAGQVRGRSDKDLIAGAQGYLTELDKLARVTGKSRKELQDAMRANADVANVAVIRSRLEGESLQNFDNNLAHVTTMLPGLGDAFKDMSDGVSQSPLAKVLEANVPGFRALAEANARGEITQEQFQQRMRTLTPQLEGFIKSMDPAQVEALMGQEGFGELMNSIGDVTTYSQRQADAQQAAIDQQRRSAVTEPFANFAQTIQNIRSDIEDALIDSGVMPTLGTALGGISTVLTDVVKGITLNVIDYLKSDDFQNTVEGFKTRIQDMAEKGRQFVSYLRSEEFKEKVDSFIQAIQNAWKSVSNFVSEIGEVGFAQAIANALGAGEGETLGDLVKNKIGEGLQSLWDNAGLATQIGAGLVALFTGAKIIGALTSGIGGMFGGLFGGGGGDGRDAPVKGPRSGGAAGKGVANFAGNVGGGVLSGIAKGLSAFASPQVAIGGAALAGVILVIGGAVAGATWLVGKSLPTFAEGMKSFEELNGAALTAAGKGMLAVAGGMAAFGAGSAVAGIGAAAGAIGDAVAGLFGGEDPMEKLLRFQSYNFDQARVEGNANAMVAFSRAMAAQGAGSAASGLGGAVGAIGDAISGFFGGDTGIPYDDIIAFQQYTFDVEKVRANAAAMVAFNNALTSSAGANAASGAGNAIGAIGNAISSFLGGDTPFDQVRNFGAMEINAEGVAANAQAMVDMANALNAFSGGEAGEIEISNNTVRSLERLSELGEGVGLGTLAADLNRVASVQGLSANITSLNSLDVENVRSYNTAMERLVETLENLNEVLAEDNEGMLGSGTGVSAASMLSSGQLGSGSSSGSEETMNRLNMLVSQLVSLQEENNRYTRGTMRAVNGNLQMGA